MKIKSYNLFLESKIYEISTEEERVIRQYFHDRLDGEVIEGKEITEDTSGFSDILRNLLHSQEMNTFRFSQSYYELDINGQDAYSSKILKENIPLFWDRDEKDKWIRKFKETNFSRYKTIIVNIKFESELIVPYLNHIFDNLIEDEYLVNAWQPKKGEWRFHIATKSSNPFQEINNSLDQIIIYM